VNRGQAKIIAASAVIAFTCALPGCVTLARKDPMTLPQDQSITINGYTTKDGVHHVCAACGARIARATAPDGTDASRMVITPAAECVDAFGGCQPSVEEGRVQSISAEEVASIEVSKSNPTGAYIGLAIVGVGVLLLLGYANMMKSSCLGQPRGCG
jgi:hypothetical protein